MFDFIETHPGTVKVACFVFGLLWSLRPRKKSVRATFQFKLTDNSSFKVEVEKQNETASKDAVFFDP